MSAMEHFKNQLKGYSCLCFIPCFLWCILSQYKLCRALQPATSGDKTLWCESNSI